MSTGAFGSSSFSFGQPAAGGLGGFGQTQPAGVFGQAAVAPAFGGGGFGQPAANTAFGGGGAHVPAAVALPELPPVINMVKVDELDSALTALQHEGNERLRNFFRTDGAALHEIIINPFLEGFEKRKAFEDGISTPYLRIPKHSYTICRHV